MLVVLPVCEKDEHLALKNLELCKHLDNKCEFDCLVSYESGFDPTKVVTAAEQYFQKVKKFQYSNCPYGSEWPRPQNWAWQQAAKHIQAKASYACWFWWEADAVPLKSGWVSALYDAWVSGGKPFAGFIQAAAGHTYMVGVGIYPTKISDYSKNALIAQSSPWDVVAGTLDGNLAKVHAIEDLLQHDYDKTGLGRSFYDREDFLAHIEKTAVIYHRCSDGSLVQFLLANEDEDKKDQLKEDVKTPERITFVITTHRRLDLCKAALESCLGVNALNVIITATGVETTKEEEDLLALGREEEVIDGDKVCKRRIKVIIPKGKNSNNAWLAGVKAATTDFVHILHDDDLVLPNFMVDVSHALDISFIYFPAKFHQSVGNYLEIDCNYPTVGKGAVSTDHLLRQLRKQNSLAVTPVRGLFRRDDLVEWLTEAGKRLPRSCYYRKDFLVGNDLWIWLRACTKYDIFVALEQPLVSLGCGDQSTTCEDGKLKEKGKLPKIYNKTREVFFSLKGVERSYGVSADQLPPLHIVTIVLDGREFLFSQLQTLNKLSLKWRWSIVEGTARNKNCTSWCQAIPERLSNDGTTEFLLELASHPNVDIYQKPAWNGKVEMVNAPLKDAKSGGVLLQMDCDEVWTAEQIEKIVGLFASRTGGYNAMFWCRYFVGAALFFDCKNKFGNNPVQEWRRAWSWQPGQLFTRHEPPILDGAQAKVIHHRETERLGLVFDHYGYATEKQMQFKKEFYGYSDAVSGWRKLQEAGAEKKLSDFFSWVPAGDSPIVKSIERNV